MAPHGYPVAQINDDGAAPLPWNAHMARSSRGRIHSRGMAMRRSVHRPAVVTGGALAALLLALTCAVLAPNRVHGATPVDGGAITIYPVTINASAGTDAYDPHVSGDIVSYTASDKIRLYDFFSGSDAGLPSTVGATDLLSDVSNGRIAFSRIETSGQIPVMLFDIATATTTKVYPQGTEQQFEGVIGASTIALIDFHASAEGELVATAGGPITQVTADTRTEQSPSVAPLGGLVVYESCATNCDIRQAAWNGSSWVVSNLTSTAEDEHNPDTDGSLIVYDAIRSGEKDIAWQPVGGGAEQRLELPGEQRNPSIRDGVISFESVAVGDTAADLFLYQVATNRLFRITSTPSDDSLNDVDVLADGRIRLVWSAGEAGLRDVYGATIELPSAGPTYHFGGFQQPVDARPTLNKMKAGGAVPVKFSLRGNQGLSIFNAGYPKSQVIACDTTANVDGIELTVSAGSSSLTYDPSTDTYSYVWKTDKSWAGTCRQLVLAFVDGSVQRANFTFK